MSKERARPVITRGPYRVVGKFPSLKSDRMLHWESQLERDRMRQLELDPKVRSFREQPETYVFKLDGKLRSYTPDLEVVLTCGKVVIEEIKPADKVEKYAELFQFISSYLAEKALYFSVVTDTTIRRQPYMDNVAQLLSYRRRPIDHGTLMLTERTFKGQQVLSMAELCAVFSDGTSPPWQPYALLSQNIISADLEKPLSPDCQLTFNEGAIQW